MVTLFGEATIDLRAAELDRVTELRILTVVGTTTVLLPDHIVLELTQVALLADHDLDAVGRPRPTAPVLRLSLVSVIGRVRLRSSPDLPQELYA